MCSVCVCVCVCVCVMFSHSAVSDSATPWTVAHQAPLSMGILQVRILEWVTMTPSRDLPNPGIKSRSPALPADSLPAEPRGKPTEKGWEVDFWGIIVQMSLNFRVQEHPTKSTGLEKFDKIPCQGGLHGERGNKTGVS